MGNACGGRSDLEAQQNRQIDKEMRQARLMDSGKIKLLLLGAGESGKSTFFKQMKLLYSNEKNFSTVERERFIKVVYSNMVIDARALVMAAESRGKLGSAEAKRAGDIVKKWQPKNQAIGSAEGEILKALWEDEGVCEVWNDRGDIQIQDAFEYFMKRIDTISSSSFLPTDQDILRTRVKTSGVVQEAFQIDGTKFEMYDVGGQRNERRKWIGCFDGVTSLIFVVAVSEYNQRLHEDRAVNRQDESVDLFKQQLESPHFIRTPVILFLNKKDLFREKLAKIPFRMDAGNEMRNVDFAGPHCNPAKKYDTTEGADEEFEMCYGAACEHLKRLYERQAPDFRKLAIYTHFTNSTDSSNIEHIMSVCKDIILKDSLRLGGWIVDP